MIVLTLAGIVTAISAPNFRTLLQVYRRDGAVQQVVGDVRKARTEAVKAGWQYRVYGFNGNTTSAYKNQYRLMGRSSGAVAWPNATDGVFQSATQMLGSWVDINKLYPGITLNPADITPDFWVTFDSRGVRIDLEPSFNPMAIANQRGNTRSISITAVGSVTIQ